MLKVGLAGGTGHYNYILDAFDEETGAVLSGIAPGSPGEDMSLVRKALAAKRLEPREFECYKKMLDSVRPDILVVACHFGDHAKVSLEGLRHGCHIFSEKPVATTFEDLALLKEAYNACNVKFAAMFGTRYTPWFLAAYSAVRAGRIGDVRIMNAQKSYKLGERGEHYKRRDIYGGTIPWVGSHAVDWLHWFSGEEFTSVFASHSVTANRNHGELEAAALCQFTFTNGVFGSVNIDYLRPPQAPTHDDDRIRIAGTRGVIEVRGGRVFLINDEQEGIPELALEEAGQSFRDYLRSVAGIGECLVSPGDSFLVTEACLKARQSADEGKVVYF